MLPLMKKVYKNKIKIAGIFQHYVRKQEYFNPSKFRATLIFARFIFVPLIFAHWQNLYFKTYIFEYV